VAPRMATMAPEFGTVTARWRASSVWSGVADEIFTIGSSHIFRAVERVRWLDCRRFDPRTPFTDGGHIQLRVSTCNATCCRRARSRSSAEMRGDAPASEDKKADNTTCVVFRIPMPPFATGIAACLLPRRTVE